MLRLPEDVAVHLGQSGLLQLQFGAYALVEFMEIGFCSGFLVTV